jgi:translation initiation factor 2 alpha subunit (eIF-2alpha)
MFQDKVFHVEPKNEVVVNTVLVVETKSQNPKLVSYGRKTPEKPKTMEDWEKEEQLQKTFKLIVQKMQAPESTVETTLRT